MTFNYTMACDFLQPSADPLVLYPNGSAIPYRASVFPELSYEPRADASITALLQLIELVQVLGLP